MQRLRAGPGLGPGWARFPGLSELEVQLGYRGLERAQDPADSLRGGQGGEVVAGGGGGVGSRASGRRRGGADCNQDSHPSR